MKKNKFQKNSKYFTITVYAIAGFLICALLIKLIFDFSNVWNGIKVVIGVLSPFVIGMILAYLINPIYKFFDVTFFRKWLHLKKRIKLRKALSLLISYIIVLGIVISIFYVVIPQFVTSMKSLVATVSNFSVTLQDWLDNLQEHFVNLKLDFLNDNIASLLPTLMTKVKEWAEGVMPQILSTSVDVIKGVINAILAITISVYILADKEHLENSLRKFYYAVFKRQKASTIARLTIESSNIFSNYFTGKIFDSLIVGFLCGIGMLILRLPYPLLIAVIVGVTNIIPYFGPMLGAIPSILIMLMTGWKEAIIFTIFILVLQQIDGNLIGPKILGNSTGLSPIWVVFAITVGSWVGGVMGMLFGVPVMAVIGNIAEEIINNRLEKKGFTSMVERNEAPTTQSFTATIKKLFSKKDHEDEELEDENAAESSVKAIDTQDTVDPSASGSGSEQENKNTKDAGAAVSADESGSGSEPEVSDTKDDADAGKASEDPAGKE